MHKMKIIILMFIVTMTLFPLTSCSFFGSVFSKIIGETEEEMGVRRVEEIMSAIENQDRDAIKSMFSEEALENTDDIDKGIDYLFALVEGKYESYEANGSNEGKSIGVKEKKYLRYRFGYFLRTDKEQYYISFSEYKIDNANPKNIGLKAIKMCKESDRNSIDYDVYTNFGIYFPTE